jgi:DNA repair exonuclease SbcCD ATPase subunit
MWQTQRQESGSAVHRLSQKFGTNGAPVVTPLRTQQPRLDIDMSPNDSSRSRSSTLNGDEQDFEFPEKTPTSLPKHVKMDDTVTKPSGTPAAGSPPHVPGPLETQLAALMTKLVFMEQKNPTISITPDDYASLSQRLQTLEAEKKSWTKRHEAIWALRDEDVENNIKIRGLLAKARRDLEAMTQLRNEDLVNVQVVRIKLADATRQLDRLQAHSGRTSPNRASRTSVYMERRDTTDLFAVAKAAALQQRALELEKRNSNLLAQIETLKGGANVDDLNRMTAHKAWKDNVYELEAKLKAKDVEIARLRVGGGGAPSGSSSAAAVAGSEWQRVEALHEEHASYREKMGGKLQALRSEKEGLQRELHRKEDECHGLEVRVQSLQRRVGGM